ncbi:MAG: cyclic-di-AMP receptor [Clostridiales bacterium]|nr:cyclic-di-AMP receptor [Clostridiales bacterium]
MEKPNMKMVIAIIQDEDRHTLSDLLVENGFRATQLTSSGSFLRSGNTTMMIGVEERRLDELLDVIKSSCRDRQPVNPSSSHLLNFVHASTDLSAEITTGGATIFVIDMERFIRF